MGERSSQKPTVFKQKMGMTSGQKEKCFVSEMALGNKRGKTHWLTKDPWRGGQRYDGLTPIRGCTTMNSTERTQDIEVSKFIRAIRVHKHKTLRKSGSRIPRVLDVDPLKRVCSAEGKGSPKLCSSQGGLFPV